MKPIINKLAHLNFYAFILGLAISSLSLFFLINPYLHSRVQNAEDFLQLDPSGLTKTITASGSIEAENQTVLGFLNPGRVAYLGVKEGDQVQQGRVVASLDTTVAYHNVAAAEAQYRSAQAALNQVLDNIHLFQYGNGGFANVGSSNETQTQKTQRQQAEEVVNVSYDSLQSAKTALAMSTIIAPFDAKVLSIQNMEVGTNVGPTSGSTITLVGSGKLKFVAHVLEQNVNNVSPGEKVSIKLDAQKDKSFSGTVEKIAADKSLLANGSTVVAVDITSSELESGSQVGESGVALITSSQAENLVVPSWTILGDQYVWVLSDNKMVMKQIKVGPSVDGQTQINSGLDAKDQVIANPKIIAGDKYTLL